MLLQINNEKRPLILRPKFSPQVYIPKKSLYFNQTEPPQKHSIIKGSFDHVVSKTLIPQGHDYNIVEDK
ncbi:MAG: hypothetical protein EGR08_07215 [Prevotella sp.]|nr:hypothetical protein [Prevotella sp.]